MHRKLIIAALATPFISTAALAGIEIVPDPASKAAQPQSSLSVGVGVAHSAKAYLGYDERQSVIPMIEYNNAHIYFKGFELGYKLLEDQQRRWSVFIGASGEEFDASKSRKLRAFDDRDMSAMLGTRYRHASSWGVIDAKVAVDVSDNSDGSVASISYGYPIQANDDWMIMPRGFVKMMDSDYANYYYGVSEEEARTIGATAYQPGSSIKYGVELISSYQLNQDWQINAGARLQMLDSDLRDSPMVSDDNEVTFFTGVTYRFW
ncbi:MipA/OmpV family protein [Neiella sp. HB171785]|uniref:MipA/OmpV family protein n=1 Tax=Neiella litorisoli TaxID=2771431 RepID=A0A8J6QH08_9GAMM|nr:MipA/OmpV family protein [Neiella litorisoli]MBD1388223.1 MipA/OmpV family protein [Neiella litorisoli]